MNIEIHLHAYLSNEAGMLTMTEYERTIVSQIHSRSFSPRAFHFYFDIFLHSDSSQYYPIKP